MAVLLVVCHRGNQVFIVIYPRFWKMSPDFALAVHGLLSSEAEGLLKSPGYFFHDSIRPFRQKEVWAGSKPKQRVSQWHLDQNARIQHYGTPTLPSSVPP